MILLQPMLRAGIFANFQVNKTYIAKYLCEKRNEAKNTCKGKCHLKKQLAKTSETDKKGNQNEKVNLETQQPAPFFAAGFSISQFYYLNITRFPYLEGKYWVYSEPAFHPPATKA